VLVKEVNWLGDLIISLPALHAVRQAYPEAHLAVLVKRQLATFFDGLDWVDEVMPYDVAHGLHGVADRWRIVDAIRARRFDLAVLFPRSFEAAFWVALARVPQRAGVVADARGPLLTRKAVLRPDERHTHQTHDYLSMLQQTLGIASAAEAVPLGVDAPSRIKMLQWLARVRRRQGRLIALAVAAAYGPAKEWPPGHYARVIDALAERDGVECVLVGAPAERALCDRVAAQSRHGALVAAGETSVGEMVALLSLCQGFAGNDSGAMHVAAALGIPTVALFGSTDPLRTGPRGPRARVIYHAIECAPCLQRTCRFGHYHCLTQIEAREVMQALDELGALA
jgi:heptosyltransferase-2